MTILTLTPAQRSALRARAHALKPVVIIGDAGLSPAVLKEIDHAIASHELIKVRAAEDERSIREEYLQTICETLSAAPVQHIGKLFVVYRPGPVEKEADQDLSRGAGRARKTPAKTSRTNATVAKRNPISGRNMAPRKISKTAARKIAQAARPPRTERVRKSGQRSAKKPFQDN